MRSDLLERMAAEPRKWWSAAELSPDAPERIRGVGMALRGMFTRGYVERRSATRKSGEPTRYRLRKLHEALKLTQGQTSVFLGLPRSREYWSAGSGTIRSHKIAPVLGLMVLQIWERRSDLIEWVWFDIAGTQALGAMKKRQRRWRLTRKGLQVQKDAEEIVRWLTRSSGVEATDAYFG